MTVIRKLSLLTFIFFGIWSFAQTSIIQNKIRVHLGGTSSFFQDTKYSDLKYFGFGINSKIVFSHARYSQSKKKNIRNLELVANVLYTHSSPREFSQNVKNMHGQLFVRYLFELGDSNLSLGPMLDLFDVTYRRTSDLVFNENYFNNRFALAITLCYHYKKFAFNLTYGLVNAMNELPSFGFSGSQGLFSNNIYDGYNDKPIKIFDLNQYVMYWFGNTTQLHIESSWQFSHNFSVYYSWRYYQQSVVKGRPSIFGNHNIGISSYLMNKHGKDFDK